MNAKQVVRDGFDRVSLAYRSDDGDGDHAYGDWIDELCSALGSAP